ncbi:MAG: ComEA family DNA-binding protein, partial [Dehalococcoidia bacterium]
RHRALIIALLLGLIFAGGAFFLYRQAFLSGTTEIMISPPSPEIHVYVEGEVVAPGTYVLEDGDRVVDAIEAAGGFTTDADRGAMSLAPLLRDGQQVQVYKVGDVSQKINLNTAESWLLQILPGIGEVLAQRIVDYRGENGGFQQIEDLIKVDGIGAGTLDKLKDMVTVR